MPETKRTQTTFIRAESTQDDVVPYMHIKKQELDWLMSLKPLNIQKENQENE